MPSRNGMRGEYPSKRWAFGDVRVSDRHVPGLVRQALNGGFPSQARFQRANQGVEIDRMRVAEIKHIVLAVVMERRNHPLNRIGVEGVIASARAIAEHRNWFALGDQSGELVNGEVGPLARSIHREEAQANRANVIEM